MTIDTNQHEHEFVGFETVKTHSIIRVILKSQMGACSSSTEVIEDPYSGQVKVKKRLGGAPPALRKPQPPTDIIPTPQLNQPLHYVSYGCGNALYLMNQQGHSMNDASEYVQGTFILRTYR